MNIKTLRESAKMTQQSLADSVGVTRQMISAIENGARPGIDTAKKIANTLGFDWRLFYPDDPDESAKGGPGDGGEGVRA